MNIQASKMSFIIVCASSTAIITTAFWIKYRRSKKIKPIEKRLVDETLTVELIDTVMDDILPETAAINANKHALDCVLPKEWTQIGKIKELFIYPLKSGRGRQLKESVCTDYGLAVKDDGCFLLRDRMFLVYKEGTSEFKTGRNYPTLVLVTLTAIDETHVRLEAVGMPGIIFKVPDNTTDSNLTSISCLLWWGEAFECIDCGSDVARWISRFLTGTNNGLRLGCALGSRNNIGDSPWQKFDSICSTPGTNDSVLDSTLASCMVITESSVYELNQKLDRPGLALQFRPNIVVSGPLSFAEDNWEWIKIGESVVIRNIKPNSSFEKRSKMLTAEINKKSASVGIHCGIYQTGNIKIGDDVYIHRITDEKGRRNPKFESERLLQQEVPMNGHKSVSNGLL